mmetsp:Transcript_30437/g.97116  ORF Transcript_30437/g.97116 Transcript_30437/m.97116 type:complete len:148 (-) Transcript_30437:309-752(-)
MSAFNPPKSLSKEDIRNIADVRRNLWSAGFKGLAWGLMGGGAVVFGLRNAPLAKMGLEVLTKYRSTNHAMLIIMGSGASVSFFSALAAGRNSMYLMEDVLLKSRYDTLSPYQKAVAAKGLGMDDDQKLLQKMEESHRERLGRLSKEE